MSNKKAAASADHRRAKAAKKKSGEKRRKPTPRQVHLIAGLAAGKTTRQAALDAGYSMRMADHAGELLGTEALRAFCQRRLSLDKVLMRINEGMDAERVEIVVLGRKGDEQIDVERMPDYSERRQSAALAAKLIGADPASKIEVHGDVTTLVKVEFVDVAAIPS